MHNNMTQKNKATGEHGMDQSIISWWRNSEKGTGGITALVLTTFLWMQLYPVAAAAKEVIQGKGTNTVLAAPASFPPAPADRPVNAADPQRATMVALSKTLNTMYAALKHHRDLIIKRKDRKGNLHITILGTKADVDLTGDRKKLAQVKQQLALQDRQAEADFQRDEAHIKAYHLPAIIQQRHDAAVAKYQKNRDAFQKGLATLAQSRDLNTLLSQSEALLKKAAGDLPQHAKFDPNNLPFRTADSKVREPATTPAQLKKILSVPAGTRAQASQRPALPLAARKQSISKTELALIQGDGQPFPYPQERHEVMVATMGSLAGLMAMSVVPPTADDLTPTEDVQITPAIQALATQLHNNPVEIYNWVHNNIEFLPSYGSIQGSQLTLDKKQGNAFDTSSLLIALLRAANIPSRYVYGTIEVPADKINNWVGGTTSPDATQQLLGQGGIPNAGLTQGGQTVAIRMEHVWVEAYVDAYPSRGARNLTPDAWMPMDASFKQYTYTQGMDLQSAVPFDANAVTNVAEQGATVDQQNDYVQSFSQGNIQSALSNYQDQLKNYIVQQNSNATVGDVLGSKIIQAQSPSTLPTGLPYRVDARGNTYGTLPSSLRQQFQYALYADAQSLSLQDPIFQYQASTPSLAEKKITLVFVPASDSDLQTFESYLPKPHEDGSPIQPGEVPDSFPAYQINVTAQLRINGQIVVQGGEFSLGAALLGQGGFTNMDLGGGWDLTEDSLTAGQMSALGVDLQGISATQLNEIQSSVQSTLTVLQSGDAGALTSENLSGDFLTAGIWSYFSSLDSFGRMVRPKYGISGTSGLSYGFFHIQVAPLLTYGVPTSAIIAGVLMDVGHVRTISYSKDNTVDEWIKYNQIAGMHASAMEHVIPERALSSSVQGQTPQAMSAVKALRIANSVGQKIYLLDQSNQNELANVHQSTDVISDITNAINAGKRVTVSESPISYAGFSGTGYIVTDPHTGSGAYLIAGGARGGSLSTEESPSIKLLGTFCTGLLDSLVIAKNPARSDYLSPPSGLISMELAESFSKALGLIAFTATTVNTVLNPSYSALQKIGVILVNLVMGIAGVELGTLLAGSLLLAPLWLVLVETIMAAVIIDVAVDGLDYLVTGEIIERRKRFGQPESRYLAGFFDEYSVEAFS
ncbi:MAG: transglutaminase-like domain-containing protein [Stenotrophobium sp.]